MIIGDIFQIRTLTVLIVADPLSTDLQAKRKVMVPVQARQLEAYGYQVLQERL